MEVREKLESLSKTDLENILLTIADTQNNSKEWLTQKIEEYLDKKGCECYFTRYVKKNIYSPLTGTIIGSFKIREGYCSGTKECEVCSCGGNKNKCDKY